jgi:hypothetical protein
MKHRILRQLTASLVLLPSVVSAHPGHDHAGLDQYHNPLPVPSLSPWHHALALVALIVLATFLYRSRRPIVLRLAGAAATLAAVALWIGAR